jgi:hypothetical protein
MDIFSSLTGESYNKNLLTLSDFTANYTLAIEMESRAGEEAPVIYRLHHDYYLTQNIVGREIVNAIELKLINGEAENSDKEAFDKIIALAQISRTYKVLRDLHGQIKSIQNADQLQADWQHAKANLIPALYKQHWERRGFIAGYEKGITRIAEVLQNNWQYLLMLPEVYAFHHYIDPFHRAATPKHRYKSRYASQAWIEYEMIEKNYSRKGNKVFLKLASNITNLTQLEEHQKVSPEFDLKTYDFRVVVSYELDALSGKVLAAECRLEEAGNKQAAHSVIMSLSVIEVLVPVSAAAPVQKSDNNWSVFDGLE